VLTSGWSVEAHAGKRTVCTITVNSSDEKEMFKQRLPASQYEFVELVERGRPDWLESACRQGVRCDMLIISGHFDGDNNGTTSSIRIVSRRANSCRSRKWSASRAANLVPACSPS
jgi:hypothetical protein